MINGYVIYNGPSLIDGKPIIVIALKSSSNRKTGNVLQSYVLRADIHPLMASKLGEDKSICGTCPHRGTPTDNPAKKQAENRSCYVALFQGPAAVYRSFVAGKYPDISGDTNAIIKLGAYRMVRLGSYGDPLAAPSSVWRALLSKADGHTSYTHQSGMLPAQAPDNFPSMVSADSEQEGREYRSRGFRTFRVIPVAQWQAYGKDNLSTLEVLCPASIEATKHDSDGDPLPLTTCDECRLCNGNMRKGKSVAIVAHGLGKNKVKEQTGV